MSNPIPSTAPTHPGIYTFSRHKKPLYIGKAENLKKRLSSYFRKNVSDKVHELLKETTKLEWVETSSDIEALIKEAEFIKKYRPKYNVLMRDDKNYFYVGITREVFPRIFVTHQPRMKELRIKNKELAAKKSPNSKFLIHNSKFVGPFTNGEALRITLKLLRRIFPYCTCKTAHKRLCLNAQINRCLGYCCVQNDDPTSKRSRISWTIWKYRKNIRSVDTILRGKRMSLLRRLREEMRQASKKREFEAAAKLRDQVAGLENVFSHRPFHYRGVASIENSWGKIERVFQTILGVQRHISRVEGYDISNISGTDATGSMVVFINGLPAKSEYRKFKIKTVHQPSDVDMLKEVITRRLKHSEWQYPDLMLIDGGKPQLNAASAALIRRKSDFPREVRLPPVAALAKREEELYTTKEGRPIPLKNLPQESAFFLQRVRDESHRFAKKYHHKLRELKVKSGWKTIRTTTSTSLDSEQNPT